MAFQFLGPRGVYIGDRLAFHNATGVLLAWRFRLVTILAQMDGHLGLLANLDEHEFAHVNIVFLGHAPPRVQINLVSG